METKAKKLLKKVERFIRKFELSIIEELED